jgi:hypothetical protein
VFTTKRLLVDAVRWDSGNLDEIRQLAGDDFLHFKGGRLWVLNADGPFEVLHGWWIARPETGGRLFVYSGTAWDQHWRPVVAGE